MITATVATGSETSTATTTDGIDAMASAVTRNQFAYWDADGNGDPTCAEAWNKDDGLRLPAYGDNRKKQARSTNGLRRARRVTATASRARAPGTRMDVLPPLTRPHRSPVYEGARPDRRRGQTCRSAKRACGRDAFGSGYRALEVEAIQGPPDPPRRCRLPPHPPDPLPCSVMSALLPVMLLQLPPRSTKAEQQVSHTVLAGRGSSPIPPRGTPCSRCSTRTQAVRCPAGEKMARRPRDPPRSTVAAPCGPGRARQRLKQFTARSLPRRRATS